MKKIIYVLTIVSLIFHLKIAQAQKTNGNLIAQSGLTFKTGSIANNIDKTFGVFVYDSKTYVVFADSNGNLIAQSGLTFKTGSVANDIDKTFGIFVYDSKTYAVFLGSL